MNVLQACVLGTVQGLTELLPISSTAHLRIVPAFLGWQDPGAAFTAVVQVGTILALLVYFWRDISRIIWTWSRSLWRPELRGELDAQMGWFIGLGTVPIVVCGVLFAAQVENAARNLWVSAVAMIAIGLLMLLGEWVGRQKRELRHMTLKDGLIIGCWQAVALIPGSSRSGVTITGGLFLGLTRDAAARYSFLLSVPAVIAAGTYELSGITEAGAPGIVPTAVASLFAFVAGYASIAWLLRFISRHSFGVFVAYRVVVGLLIIGLLSFGVMPAT